jgi:HEAT repeat protein
MLNMEDYKRKGERVSVSIDTLSQTKRLIANLRSHDGETRREARIELVFMGKPAVDFLIPMLKDLDDDVRWEAVKALSEIADPRASSDLASLLLDHNFGVRWLASEALISLGREAIQPLLERLQEHPESSWLRRGAHHVLHDLRKKVPDLEEVVGPVITALEGVEPEIGVLEAAYIALGKLKGSMNKMNNLLSV